MTTPVYLSFVSSAPIWGYQLFPFDLFGFVFRRCLQNLPLWPFWFRFFVVAFKTYLCGLFRWLLVVAVRLGLGVSSRFRPPLGQREPVWRRHFPHSYVTFLIIIKSGWNGLYDSSWFSYLTSTLGTLPLRPHRLDRVYQGSSLMLFLSNGEWYDPHTRNLSSSTF